MEYEKYLVELDEILSHLSDEDLEKIPYEIRKAINEKKDKNYNWKYNESKELREQDINRKTIAMLSYINTEYLLNKEQKLLMNKLHRFNENEIEKEKSRKYDSNNIFNNNNTINDKNKDIILAKSKTEKWYEKVFSFITNIFKKN